MDDRIWISRRAARVLLVDAAGRVLLFHGFDPNDPGHRYWFTVGGGLEPDESAAEGGARELYEETGLAMLPADLGEPVWQDVTEFPFEGRWYRQDQDYFLVRVPSWTVDVSHFDAAELRSVDAHRWWSVAELESASDPYYPQQLPRLLTRLLGVPGGADAAVAGAGGTTETRC
jgi:8-oxo-dGTP pyrophosphatase MutT (NUDIX family)